MKNENNKQAESEQQGNENVDLHSISGVDFCPDCKNRGLRYDPRTNELICMKCWSCWDDDYYR